MSDEVLDGYDVVVIGGGAAGLNGALMLARSRRTVLVVDAGQPRNRPAQAVHGLLGHDGISPAELLERGRDEVRHYGGEVTNGEVTAAVPDADGGFVVAIADGRRVRARRLLVASGLVDELPGVPGLRERWGRDVVHCPYCHGWEVRDRAIGVLATGPMSVHQALLFRQLSEDVVYFANETALDEAQTAQLAARGIRVVDGRVSALAIDDDRLAGLRLADGGVVPREVVTVGARMVARAGFLRDLGLRASAHPSGMGEHIPVDAAGRTEVAGVWAAGNVADLSAQVGTAAAAGAFAAAQINADLAAEEAQLAAKAIAQR
ncbi:MAG TPA: NAD(P)/FAD-dependent oxidoreductase [Trebonia sp.]|nr:NAD(P)/FAD-dependent oxidoreductase [Trebonia sp.]